MGTIDKNSKCLFVSQHAIIQIEYYLFMDYFIYTSLIHYFTVSLKPLNLHFWSFEENEEGCHEKRFL